ncbi:hypothetical protein AAFF_G00371640 [Aldrovandia affinis]|uniref:Mitochondrial import inner membrane translocase subunit Tim10 B n=1 Tax=Aldrovandia affinis TaxID=143900 RepID=A0AAD7WNA0_9TELE|nr:hypothetical protein AAFF_G00371640 [Aldrovandia affinis]
MEQDQQQVRNLRDFLLVYNRMTEICFQRCTSNLNYRNLTMDEEHCVDSCAGKLIRSNHRLMGTYVQLLPALVQRRLDEMAAKSGQMAKAAEAGANGETLPLATAELAVALFAFLGSIAPRLYSNKQECDERARAPPAFPVAERPSAPCPPSCLPADECPPNPCGIPAVPTDPARCPTARAQWSRLP